ncbi:MAG: DNA-processing protein DprA [Flaviflexus sp.]|nr:DNA-processing protein DprA [Flaviflexus sp.]
MGEVNTALSPRAATALWTAIAEPPSPAPTLIDAVGPVPALEMLRAGELAGYPELGAHPARWLERLAHLEARGWDNPAEHFLMPGDPHWPTQLADLGPERPLGLWVEGRPEVLTRPALTIVGARAATPYGTRLAGSFAAELSASHVIVSGGAFGIDVAAHEGALAAGGATVAVMSCGIDRAYPARHARVFSQITGSGAIISEYPPGTAPARHRFLVRNRLIAALGTACLVVEAGRRSGALATARRAAEIGREVLAVPGPVGSRMSSGTNQLLRDYGICATEPGDVLEAIGQLHADPPPTSNRRKHDCLRGERGAVHDALTDVASPLGDIARRAGLTGPETRRALSGLVALGFAAEATGGWHRLEP